RLRSGNARQNHFRQRHDNSGPETSRLVAVFKIEIDCLNRELRNRPARARPAPLRRNVARRGRLTANSRCPRDEKAGSQQTAGCNCALPVARLNRKVAAVRVKTEAEITRMQSRKIWIGLILLALLALGAAFLLDQPIVHWINTHSSPELKQVMRIVSRVGDWPAHMIT